MPDAVPARHACVTLGGEVLALSDLVLSVAAARSRPTPLRQPLP
ncbi:MAG: hypothetical protein ABI131_03505 [Nostocoides sp.]